MAMTTITSTDSLSNSGFHRSGGKSSGAAHWWLRRDGGDFVALPERVRGDRDFSVTLDLAPGTYVLGTGKGKDAIRQTIVVVE